MAFKTYPTLERHIKYSDLHSKNVMELEMAANANSSSSSEALEVNTVSELDAKRAKMVEGCDYRLLYSGSKFYWKCQETIDIFIYQHMETSCLEIICFDLQRNKELPRYSHSITLLKVITITHITIILDFICATLLCSKLFFLVSSIPLIQRE